MLALTGKARLWRPRRLRLRLFTTAGQLVTRPEANLALFEYIDGFCNPAASRDDSATSARSSTRRSTTPTRQLPDK
jgi:hypothetical protein